MDQADFCAAVLVPGLPGRPWLTVPVWSYTHPTFRAPIGQVPCRTTRSHLSHRVWHPYNQEIILVLDYKESAFSAIMRVLVHTPWAKNTPDWGPLFYMYILENVTLKYYLKK